MRKKRKKISDILMSRLKKDLKLNIKKGYFLRRNNPGHWQREAGAWLWEVDNKGTSLVSPQSGSQWTMKQCVEAKTLIADKDYQLNDIYIDPYPEPHKEPGK